MTSESTDGIKRSFRHPFLQACGMFVGEMFCMVAFYVVKWIKKWKRNRRNNSGIEVERLQDEEDEPEQRQTPYNPLIFFPPAMCDMTATSIQYIGLTLTYASSFQMLRGAVIVFTGLLSMLVLRRRLQAYRWIGIVFVIMGLVIVGLCDILYKPSKSLHQLQDHSNQTFFSGEFYGVY